MKLFTKSSEPDARLGILEETAFGLGNSANAIIYGIITAFLVFYYTDTIGLNSGVIGTIMLFSRIFDGVTDLIMGRIVDRTKAKTGKAGIWILRVCIPYAISGVLLFLVPESVPSFAQYVYVFLSYNLVNAILFTAITVPYNSLAALITTDSFGRGLLGTFSMIGSVAVSVIMNSTILNMVANFGGGKRGWVITVAIYSAIGLALHLICYFGTHERVGTQPADSRSESVEIKTAVGSLFKNNLWVIYTIVTLMNWFATGMLQTSLVYYVTYVLKDESLYASLANAQSLTMVIFLFVAVPLMKKFGKVNTFRLGLLLMVGGTLIKALFGMNYTMLMAGAMLGGMGSGFAGAVSVGLLADVLDFGEWKTGIACVGIGMATASFVQKIGYGLSSSVWGLLLSGFGYDGAAQIQSASAVMGIQIGFLYLPFVCYAVMLLLMMRFPLDRIYPQVSAELKERRSGTQAAR